MLGGAESLADWASKTAVNRTQFYTWMHSWIPKEMDIQAVKAQKLLENETGGGGQNITIISQMHQLPEPEMNQVIPIEAVVSDSEPAPVIDAPVKVIDDKPKLLSGERLVEDGNV